MLDFGSPLDGIRSPLGPRRGRAFSPSTLFALAEPGVWFDPSDLTTLFTDPEGTTPVTAPGNTVGLMLDKSKGLALGAELVTFSSDPADYALANSTAVTDGAGLLVTKTASNQYVTRSTLMALTAGQSYLITADVQNISCSEGAFRFFLSAGSTGSTIIGTLVGALNSGTLRGYVHVPAGFTSGYLNIGHSSGGIGQFKINSFSVRELAGNHATQATLTARPTYSIEPVGGRRNLLTFSEDYSVTTGGWAISSGVTFSGQTATFTSSAYRYQTYALGSSTSGRTFTASVVLSSATKSKITLRISGGDAADDARLVVNLTSTPTRYTLTRTFTSSFTTIDVGLDNRIAVGADGIAGDLVATQWQFELGSTATNYQKVTTQYDVTEAGVASVGYLYFDGAGDFMTTTVDTNTIFGVAGTDPGYLLVGGAKYNTASGATGAFARSAFCGDSAGYFSMWAHTVNGGEAGLYQLDTGIKTAERPYAVGSAAVFTGRRNPSEGVAGKIYASVNGVSSAGTDAAALNGISGLFLVGKTLGGFLNGHIYSLIARGALTDAPTITSTEIWVGDKTGIDVAKNISTTIYTRSGDTILDRANSTIERRAV